MEFRMSENSNFTEEELTSLIQTTGYVELDQKEVK
jgi:hypothetical protein